MKRIKTLFARFRRDQSGASAVEFSIVATVFVIASMGVMELGRTYQVRNELAYAGDIAARRLTIIASDPSVAASDYGQIITDEVEATFKGYPGASVNVQINPVTLNGIKYQELTLSYPMSVFIPLRTDTYQLQVTRRAVQL